MSCPYDIENKDITFKEVYETWSKEYFKTLKSVSSVRTVTSAFSYCSSLYNKRMRDIKSCHLKDCMENG